MELPRRSLLQAFGMIGLAACTSTACAGSGSGGAATPTSASGGAPWDADVSRRAERASYGAVGSMRTAIEAGGLAAWIDAQLATPAGSAAAGYAARFERLATATEEHAAALGDLRGATQQERAALRRQSMRLLSERWLIEAAFGEAQLRSRMVDHLGDLLHVTSGEAPEVLLLPSYDALLRERAFGRYDELLLATARHPAMLVFLDQATSRADGTNVPNENYARELMELHTVGVDGGYDEQDVLEVAHVLTGWSWDRRTRSFAFRAAWHDLGPLSQGGDVLGWTPEQRGPAGREQAEALGESLIRHLAHHPATARRIAWFLTRRFVTESAKPDDPLVAEAARVYLDHDTELGPVVRHLLTHDAFSDHATLMVRRPLDLLASTLRRTDAEWEPGTEAVPAALAASMRAMGQTPYGWSGPDGYPWASSAWANAGSMIARWNALTTIAATEAAGVRFDWSAFDASDSATAVTAMCGPDHQLL